MRGVGLTLASREQVLPSVLVDHQEEIAIRSMIDRRVFPDIRDPEERAWVIRTLVSRGVFGAGDPCGILEALQLVQAEP